MQNLILRGNKVAVEKLKKRSDQRTAGFIMPDKDQYVGHIKYVGESAKSDLKVGQKVYFSTKHEAVHMAGSEVCIMEDSEVLAIVQE